MAKDTHEPSGTDFFTRDMAAHYDERNSKLVPISDNMHFLAGLVLGDLPPRARILCVGAGTGAEILALANAHPEWSFVGVDPSAAMLDICRERLEQADVLSRCELVPGYINDLANDAEFDAVLSFLVAHFVRREERADFYWHIHHRLKPGGSFVSTEISFDLDSPEFPAMLKNWDRIQSLMGATPDSLQHLSDTLRQTLSVISPTDTEVLLRAAGFALPVQFFQAFMIHGWYATK